MELSQNSCVGLASNVQHLVVLCSNFIFLVGNLMDPRYHKQVGRVVGWAIATNKRKWDVW